MDIVIGGLVAPIRLREMDGTLAALKFSDDETDAGHIYLLREFEGSQGLGAGQ